MKIKSFLVTLLLSALAIAGCNNNAENTVNNMDKLSFNDKQAANISAIACYEAKGNLTALAAEINDGFDNGLTISQIKEALSHLYAYTGFPRSLNSLGVLQKVIDERRQKGLETNEGTDASPLPKDFDALNTGTIIQTQLSGQPFNYTFCPAEDYYLKAHLFGDIFARNNLTYADRELVTVSALSGLQGVEPQLAAHVKGAFNMGLADNQIRQIVVSLATKGLETEAGRAAKAIAGFLNSEYPQGNPNDAYAQYFTGQSYLADLGGAHNVTFEPGCRNNWHIHHHQVQVLICVFGKGWYQEEDKPAVEMTPGTVIAVPEGVKHWHGAQKDSRFQHLTIHRDIEDGASNEWLESVTDQVYLQAGNSTSSTTGMIVRIAEIEVEKEYLNEYLAAAKKVGKLSVEREEGVVCIFPMQVKEHPTTVRIVEIYRSNEAYQSHLKTPHFLEYKQGTLPMVKSLNLIDTEPLAPEMMKEIFAKI